MSEPLSVIQPLSKSKSSNIKRTPTLTVIAGHEPKEVAIGALHSSPFTIQLESLLELSREELSEN